VLQVNGELPSRPESDPNSPAPGSSREFDTDELRPNHGQRPWFGAAAAPLPFVWQSGLRLLLLDEDGFFWVFAELEFDPSICRYVEQRRAAYDTEREAVGALLSRALASGMTAVEQASQSLNQWLLDHYGHSIHESRARARLHAE
jgi:hypothetical protein